MTAPPSRFVGYGVVNKWWSIDADELATCLRENGLNITHIEYAIKEGDESNFDFRFYHEEYKKFIKAMRKNGIWTFVNVVNFNRKDICDSILDDKWFLTQINCIKEVGTNMIILQPVSEWDDARNRGCTQKAKNWHTITKDNWRGFLSWNRGSRPSSNEGWGNYFEYHPFRTSDLGPQGAIVTTDTSPIITYFQKDLLGDYVVRHKELEEYVKNVLKKGNHFIYYGYQHRLIDKNAIKTIGKAAKQQKQEIYNRYKE